jgi:hypothetical protein
VETADNYGKIYFKVALKNTEMYESGYFVPGSQVTHHLLLHLVKL